MIKVSTDEAIKTITEWGVDCDNFVAHTYTQMMNGGDPTDNSQECADYFVECLRIVCDLGIQSHDEYCNWAKEAIATRGEG